MHDTHEFLKAITVVLCVGTAITVTFQRLQQPIVLGYILAGLIVGPHVPVPLVADPAIIQTLSELGVILLMFTLGLEFSLRKLVRVGPQVVMPALLQCICMLGLGFALAYAFGWTIIECTFAGAMVAISSTTIIAKAFDEQRIGGKLRELVVGILIAEDLIAIMLMALLTTLSSRAGVSAEGIAKSGVGLGAFLVGVLAIGMLIVPRLIAWISRQGHDELTLIASIGVCFGIALLAKQFGYSVALGAFIAGSLVSESGKQKRIETMVRPVRDIFSAIFFVSVGMRFDPMMLVDNAFVVAAFLSLVIIGKIVLVTAGALLGGTSFHRSVRAGMSLAQIGEFSFIIAELGSQLGAARSFLYSLAVAVSVATTFSTPWLIRSSSPIANAIERRLPRRWRSTLSVYAIWIEQLRAPRTQETPRSRLGRWLRLLSVDVLCVAAIILGAGLGRARLARLLAEHFDASMLVSDIIILVCAVPLSLPFVTGIVRTATRVGSTLADALSLARTGDFEALPSRVQTIAFQLLVMLAATSPLFLLATRFIPWAYALSILAGGVVLFTVGRWRYAADPHQEVHAGAQRVIEALRKHSPLAHRAPQAPVAPPRSR